MAGLMMAEPMELGKAVPKVEGKNHKGEVVKLHEAAGRGWALIFFFPKAGTGG
ncbi:MAG: redoxin domain-containing protein [Akkermansiaceae bacterium]|nr:redoxin domain-containing protein [Akkermansiaceae bacterium]